MGRLHDSSSTHFHFGACAFPFQMAGPLPKWLAQCTLWLYIVVFDNVYGSVWLLTIVCFWQQWLLVGYALFNVDYIYLIYVHSLKFEQVIAIAHLVLAMAGLCFLLRRYIYAAIKWLAKHAVQCSGSDLVLDTCLQVTRLLSSYFWQCPGYVFYCNTECSCSHLPCTA